MAHTPVDFIHAWLARETKTIYPPAWNGGWERWAQGQIAQYMEGTDGHQVWTEQHIFKNDTKAAVDLEFRKPAGVHGVRQFCELKCYSSTNDDSARKFIQRVLEDYAKVQWPLTSGNPTEPSAKGSTLWVVGIAQKQFRSWIHEEGGKFIDWQNFRVVSVDTMGTSSGTTTFDIYYWAYTNNH
ncbi:hypothetical protein RBB50_010158 [Rhinocladiella similis]